MGFPEEINRLLQQTECLKKDLWANPTGLFLSSYPVPNHLPTHAPITSMGICHTRACNPAHSTNQPYSHSPHNNHYNHFPFLLHATTYWARFSLSQLHLWSHFSLLICSPLHTCFHLNPQAYTSCFPFFAQPPPLHTNHPMVASCTYLVPHIATKYPFHPTRKPPPAPILQVLSCPCFHFQPHSHASFSIIVLQTLLLSWYSCTARG